MSIGKFIVSIIIALFQGLATTTIIFSQLKHKTENKNKLIFFLLMSLFCIISFFFIPNQLRFILCIFTMFVILYFILGFKDKKALLYSFNTEMLLAASEIIISILLVLCGINSTTIVQSMIPNLVINVLMAGLAIGLIFVPIINRFIDKINNLFSKNNKLLSIVFIVVLIIYLIVSKNGLEFILKSNYYVNILFIFGMVLVLTIIIKNELKAEQLKNQNQQMLSYVTKYEEIITAQGKANHEFKNQLMVIRGYAQMNSSKLIEYIDSIVEDSRKTYSSHKISQLNKFPDGGIKGLLYYKISTIEEEKIKYELDVENGVKTKLSNLSVVSYKNITKILGVLIDNAIAASKKSKGKKITISVTKDKSNVIFNISNTYNGKIDLSKIGTGYSSKGKNHGYGLRLVKDIIENNKMLKIETACDEKFYSTKLVIKINNKKRKSS